MFLFKSNYTLNNSYIYINFITKYRTMRARLLYFELYTIKFVCVCDVCLRVGGVLLHIG